VVNMDRSSFYEAVRGRLAELWTERREGPVPDYSDTDSFVERGLIDSWSVVLLLMFVQEQTGVALDLTRSDPVAILTLNGLYDSVTNASVG
jgi:acyl carrier protein